ncbi:DoxX family protein [Micromonospora sp. KC723]|uniref:DoxX family protein n=1 Tax=Micromonospora sp. KC723 TaxID=2530381 RepID=UPI001046AFF7|nr:DoxX family protein [Micromonospora sp. KC723]TDB74394.1 DoxX family protein [Micromonospora sp. KC723]
MNIVLWILAGLLAAVFLAAGGAKLAQPKDKLVTSPNMSWAEEFSPGMIKLIGALEALAAVGLILPAALDIPVLVPLAAVGLVLLMVGAAITHARRKEPSAIVTNLVLALLAGAVAWGRFGPYPFT